MHAPPPVRIAVTPGLAWHLAQAALGAVALGCGGAWAAAQLGASGPTAWLSALCAALAGAGAVGWFARPSLGELVWDGGRWLWTPDGGSPVALEQLVATVDLGIGMLLRARPEAGGRPRWWAVARPPQPLTWAAFRAAVYFPALRTGTRPPAGRSAS